MQQTAEEARAERIEAMGEALGSHFDALWQQLVSAKRKWGEYVTLFGTNEKRVALLNAAAPQFFNLLDSILWEDTVLHIARLTDLSNTFGQRNRTNLSIRAFPELITDARLRDALATHLKAAVDATGFARDWRNRRIAHRDLQYELDRSAKPLAFASRASVNTAFEKIEAVMNAVQLHFLDSTTHYDTPISRGGAMTLLHTLHYGVQVLNDRQERLARGDWNWEKDRLPEI